MHTAFDKFVGHLICLAMFLIPHPHAQFAIDDMMAKLASNAAEYRHARKTGIVPDPLGDVSGCGIVEETLPPAEPTKLQATHHGTIPVMCGFGRTDPRYQCWEAVKALRGWQQGS